MNDYEESVLDSVEEPLSDDVHDNHFTIALNTCKKNYGCAYYDCSNASLHIMEDSLDLSDRYELITMILQQVQPKTILINNSAEESLVECVEKFSAIASSSSSTEEAPKIISTIVTRQARDFSSKSGLTALTDLRGERVDSKGDSEAEISQQTEYSDSNNFQGHGNARLSTQAFVKPENSQLSLGAVAVVLSYVKKEMKTSSEENKVLEVKVQKVEIIKLDKFMHLGTETLASLKIFDSETHANLHLSTTKEGLSLYGILNECVTHGGKLLLKNWLIRPSKDIEVIKSRQDEIEFYLKNENAQFFEKARSILKNLGNINRTIMVINSGKSRIAEWSRLLRAIKACREIQRLTSNLENAHKTELLNKLGCGQLRDLDDLKEKINSTLDWEESKINGGCINVLPGVDEELDELREQYSGLESKLQHLAQELRTMAAFDSIPEFAINYFPQIGYICTIPRPLEWDGNDFLIEKGWQFHFATDTELHYKNDYMRDLDLHIGDLATAISDREIEIVHLLEEDLERATPLLISFAEVLAEFDCILSLANSAYQRDWKRPSIVPENIIQITGGRHPLVEGSVETCISNDAFLKNSENITTSTCENYAELEAEYPKIEGRNILGRSILVVTGANFSGKSVYVKQLGVIAILSQIGSFVPAEETTIGIHDAIFTRITTTESVTKNSSAFMIDLQQISFMLRNCTAQSILLIDEFGKGTDSSDGQALFCSLINHLVERGSECPITILTTHFHEVFTRGYLPADLPIDFGHMSMVMPSGSEHEVDRSPIYLYKLKPGIISSSHALSCAAISGVPKHIRIRADRVSRMLGNFEILKLLDVCMTDEEIEDLRRMEKVVRRFVETNFESGTSDDEQNFMIHLSRHILSECV